MHNLAPGEIQTTDITIAVYQWPDIVPFQKVTRDTVVEKSFVVGVRAEMTRETWEEINCLYQAHRSRMTNPAVRDAWNQYRVVCALTDQDRPVLLQK